MERLNAPGCLESLINVKKKKMGYESDKNSHCGSPGG